MTIYMRSLSAKSIEEPDHSVKLLQIWQGTLLISAPESAEELVSECIQFSFYLNETKENDDDLIILDMFKKLKRTVYCLLFQTSKLLYVYF